MSSFHSSVWSRKNICWSEAVAFAVPFFFRQDVGWLLMLIEAQLCIYLVWLDGVIW